MRAPVSIDSRHYLKFWAAPISAKLETTDLRETLEIQLTAQGIQRHLASMK